MNSSYGRPGRTSDDSLQSTTVGLELEVNSFKVGKMRIRCVAEQYGVFSATAETVLDEEKPRLASILGTFSSAGKHNRSSVIKHRDGRGHESIPLTRAGMIGKRDGGDDDDVVAVDDSVTG